MTSLLRRQLEASLELENDPGIRAFRSINKRMRPDLSNRSDLTDVCGWMAELEPYVPAFAEEYGESKSPLPFKIADIEEVCDLTKRLIIAIQDARERAGILE